MSLHEDLKRYTAEAAERRLPLPARRRSLWSLLAFGAFFLVAYGLAGEDSYQLAREKAERERPRIELVPVLTYPVGCGQFVAQRTFSTEPWRVVSTCAVQK